MKIKKPFPYSLSVLAGIVLVGIIATIQKNAVAFIDTPIWYLAPAVVGGTFGFLSNYLLRRLLKSKRHLETLQQLVPSAIFTLDREGKIKSWNKRAEEITGYTEEEILGKTCQKFIYEECSLNCGMMNNQIIKPVLGHQTKIKTKKGEIKYIYKNLDYFRNGDKETIGVESFVDISKIIEAEKKLVEAKELAEQSDNLKSEFLAQVSHEIRTPINSISSFNQLIIDDLLDKVDDEYKTALYSIEKSCKRVTRSIDLILNMAVMQTGSYNYKGEQFHIYSGVLADLKPQYDRLASQSNLEFKIECLEDYIVYADHYTVTQIIINLLDNAFKYTNEGSVKLKISEYDPDRIAVSVKDTGIGIDKDFLPNLFKPFQQEESGYSRKYEGNGLGLSLVKEYCDLNNAILNVNTEKGKGSEFVLILWKNDFKLATKL